MNEQNSLISTDGWFKRYQRRALFSQLKHGYEVATGFKVAREEVLQAMGQLQRDENQFDLIKKGIEKDIKGVRTALLDVQRLYSEIAASITTVVAARTVLNRQRVKIEELHQEGLLDMNEFKKLKGSVEFKMKRLIYHPPMISMPKKMDILRQVPWLDGFTSTQLVEISDYFEDVVIQRDEILVEQGQISDNVYVLARGSVAVTTKDSVIGAEVEIDELGMGSVFGEIAWVLKCHRLATIRATSPGLMFTISGEILRQLSESNKELENRLWKTCGCRLSENILVRQNGKSRREIRDIIHDMVLFDVDPHHKNMCFLNMFGHHVILLKGVAIIRDDSRGTTEVIEAPDMISGVVKSENLRYFVNFSTDAKYMCNSNSFVEIEDKEAIPTSVMTDFQSMSELELKASRPARTILS